MHYDRRRVTALAEMLPTELGGAVRNEFPLLIIETIKTWPAAQWRVGGGSRTTGATVVLFIDWRVANSDDDDDNMRRP